MAASDNLNPKLFHGSSAWLKSGEVINPGKDIYYADSKPGAYATTNLDTARGYAGKWDDPERKHPSDQRSLFHPVYEVAHSSEHSDPYDILKKIGPDYRRDTEGFVVKGIADWSIGSI